MIEVDLDLGQDDWGKVEWDKFDSSMKAVCRMMRIKNIFENETFEKV
jgi:hypothetical protein